MGILQLGALLSQLTQFVAACKRPPVFCIITEYLAGGSLRKFLHKQEPHSLPLKLVLRLALDIAHGMSYLHSQGILHRDLKSENLLLGEDMSVKVADFGISCLESQCGSAKGFMGTYRWMAPEMIKGKLQTRKVDVYSFGIVLWELVTALIPFHDMTPEQAAFAVSQKNARPPIPSTCPPPLRHLISQCWATNPDKRPQFDHIVVILESCTQCLEKDPVSFLSHKPAEPHGLLGCFPKCVAALRSPSLEAMLRPAYDLLFGRLALQCLFEDYFEQARHFNTRIMLKPIEDPHVDLVATVTGPLDGGKEGNAVFHWQRDLDDPNTFTEVSASTSDPFLQIKSSIYFPSFGCGIFGIFPLLAQSRIRSENNGFVGVRYGSENLSLGTTFIPFPLASEFPRSAWLVGRMGRLCAGVQYTPPGENKDKIDFKDLNNWSWTIGYGVGSSSPLRPSFNFGLELAKCSELIASFYQHIVVQRRVTNPFEADQIVGITNYIDFGFELKTRINMDKSPDTVDKSSFQVAASWQANKNILLKGKIGPSMSSMALAFKSWWKPSFTFSITAVNDHTFGRTSYGLGIRIEDMREASYERADPNYIMLTPNKEHLAEGVLQKFGKQPMFQSKIDSGDFESLPRELKPLTKII